MHSLHADILEITTLTLKPAYGGVVQAPAPQDTLVLSEQMIFDIQLANSSVDLTTAYLSAEVGIKDRQLCLPSAQLNAQQKRQLWELLSELDD